LTRVFAGWVVIGLCVNPNQIHAAYPQLTMSDIGGLYFF